MPLSEEDFDNSNESISSSRILSCFDNVASLTDIESEEERDKFKKYWECAIAEFGSSPEGMMLYKRATRDGIAVADRNEVIQWLQQEIEKNFPVDSIIEIGAGIGRLTSSLQALCKKITVVDFMQKYIDTNRENNYCPINRPYDEFICADATTINYPDQSFDIVFWNWLLMYLGDVEMKNFLAKALLWVRVGGYLFCRESCGESSSKTNSRIWALEGNPTHYRSAQFYTKFFMERAEHSGVNMEIIFKERPVTIYKQKIGTDGQKSWLIKRVT